MPGSSGRTRSIVGRWNDDTSTSSRPPGCRHGHDGIGRRRRRSKSGSPGRFLISMFTSVAEQASRAAASAVHDTGRSAREGARRWARRSARWASWWTARWPSAVAPDVELDPVGPERHGGPEGRDGVLGEGPAGPRWAIDRRSQRVTFWPRTACRDHETCYHILDGSCSHPVGESACEGLSRSRPAQRCSVSLANHDCSFSTRSDEWRT